MTGVGEPGPVPVQYATENFFAVVGVQPAFGRVFRAEESQEKVQTIVISNDLWKTKFNSDPNVLGKSLRLNGVVSTVVGVMPAGFETFEQWYQGKNVDVWKPVNPESAKYAKRSSMFLMPVARLKPGVTQAQAQVEMDVIARGLEKAYPESNKGVEEEVVPLYDALYQNAGQTALSASWRSGVCAADRLCERGEPDAFAYGKPAQGILGAGVARRGPAAADAAIAGRERVAGT